MSSFQDEKQMPNMFTQIIDPNQKMTIDFQVPVRERSSSKTKNSLNLKSEAKLFDLFVGRNCEFCSNSKSKVFDLYEPVGRSSLGPAVKGHL